MNFTQYVGSKEIDEKADEVLKLDILDCWTPENYYRWSKSRYGNHFSASVDAVGCSSLLLCSMFLENPLVLISV